MAAAAIAPWIEARDTERARLKGTAFGESGGRAADGGKSNEVEFNVKADEVGVEGATIDEG